MKSEPTNAPVAEWVPWAVSIPVILALVALWLSAERLNPWARYLAARWQSYRWKAAGNKERRKIERPLRPGRWD